MIYIESGDVISALVMLTNIVVIFITFSMSDFLMLYAINSVSKGFENSLKMN